MRNWRKPSHLPENKGFKAQLDAEGWATNAFTVNLTLHLDKLKGAPDPTNHGFRNYFNAAKFFPKAAPYDKHYASLPLQ